MLASAKGTLAIRSCARNLEAIIRISSLYMYTDCLSCETRVERPGGCENDNAGKRGLGLTPTAASRAAPSSGHSRAAAACHRRDRAGVMGLRLGLGLLRGKGQSVLHGDRVRVTRLGRSCFCVNLNLWLELRRLPPIMGFVGSGPELAPLLA